MTSVVNGPDGMVAGIGLLSGISATLEVRHLSKMAWDHFADCTSALDVLQHFWTMEDVTLIGLVVSFFLVCISLHALVIRPMRRLWPSMSLPRRSANISATSD